MVSSNYGYGNLGVAGYEKFEYAITFITTSNNLYKVEFERFFFKKNETILVSLPKNFSDFVHGHARSFAILYDQDLVKESYVIGTLIDVGGNLGNKNGGTGLKTSTIENSLFVVFENENRELVSNMISKQDPVTGLFKEISKTITQKVSNVGSIFSNLTATGQKKVQAPLDQFQNKMNMGAIQDGVVALKLLSNQLIAVVYTSGVLRIWSAFSKTFLLEENLIES